MDHVGARGDWKRHWWRWGPWRSVLRVSEGLDGSERGEVSGGLTTRVVVDSLIELGVVGKVVGEEDRTTTAHTVFSPQRPVQWNIIIIIIS